MASDKCCGVVTIPVGKSKRKRSFNQQFCWGKRGIKSSKGRVNRDVTRDCKYATPRTVCGSGACPPGSAKPRRKAAASRPKGRKIKTTRRTTVSRNTAKTFVAKASYARTKSGKLRKGCRKVGNVYRCKKTGAAAR